MQSVRFASQIPCAVAGVVAPGVPLKTILTMLGLTTGLELCLDAGDIASVPTSGATSWLDTSGNGYDFFRGFTGSAEQYDPIFNGRCGQGSGREYYSGYSALQFFVYDTTTETWMQNVHKDSAAFTFATWVYVGALGAFFGLSGTSRAVTSDTGFDFFISSGNALVLDITNGSGTAFALGQSGPAISTGWHFCVVSVDEAATTGFLLVDSTVVTFTSTYTAPSAASATYAMAVAAGGNTSIIMPVGSRMATFAAWSSSLTQAQAASIFNATRGRYGV